MVQFLVAVGGALHQVHELADLHHSVGRAEGAESDRSGTGGHVDSRHDFSDVGGEAGHVT